MKALFTSRNKYLLSLLVILNKNRRNFKIAQTQEEKMKLFQFHYRTFIEGLGRTIPGLDHDRKIIMDDYDLCHNTVHFYLGDLENPLAVMRAMVFQPAQIPARVKQAFNLMDVPWGDTVVTAQCGRFIAAPKSTRINTFKFLLSILRYLEENCHARLLIANCKPGLTSYYMKIGLRPYTNQQISLPDGLEIPLAGFLDKEFCIEFNSPLKYMLRKHPEIKKEYFEFFSANQSLYVDDVDEVAGCLKKFKRISEQSNLVIDLIKPFIHKLVVLHVTGEMKICHEGMLEEDVYFLLDGCAYGSINGGEHHFQPGTFVTPFCQKRVMNVYSNSATLLMLKKSTLDFINKHHKEVYATLKSLANSAFLTLLKDDVFPYDRQI